jgi:hypothetical protein
MALLRQWLSSWSLSAYRRAGLSRIHGYGDVNIDSSSPGRHTPGY